MTHTIYKYEFAAQPTAQTIKMPLGARVLSFASQGGVPVIWALVNPDNKYESREFNLVFTGQPFDDVRITEDIFHGTTQVGPFVYHLFERRTSV